MFELPLRPRRQSSRSKMAYFALFNVSVDVCDVLSSLKDLLKKNSKISNNDFSKYLLIRKK